MESSIFSCATRNTPAFDLTRISFDAVRYIRGAEVIEIADESGNVVKDIEVEQGKRREGNARTMRVYLDTSQYQMDIASGQSNSVSFFTSLSGPYQCSLTSILGIQFIQPYNAS